VNSALVDQAGLVKLLIARGIITEEEYAKCIADAMEDEARRYEQELSERLGTKISLL
jgi:hypothetical protein